MHKRLLLSLCFTNLLAYAGEDLNYYRQMRTHNPRFFKEIYYHAVKPIAKELKQLLFEVPSNLLHDRYLSHPYDETEALVRFADDDELCKAEKQFLQQRHTHVKTGCEQLLQNNVPNDRVPRIGVCASGGGYRAMVLTLGFLKGLEDIGLLDCTTYMSGLSGSTWAMAPWVSSKQPVKEFINTLPHKTHKGLRSIHTPSLLDDIAKKLIAKAMNGQFISSVDIYGDLLANTLLADSGSDRLKTTLSESHAHIVDGNLPMPIYTAITPNATPYEWFEFTHLKLAAVT